jgi:DNA-binding protein H-NS
MRKPRDYDSELKALSDKARTLKDRRIRQLGELVVACGADALTPEHLAGAVLAAAEAEAPTQEGWRRRGAAFFQRGTRGGGAGTTGDTSGAASRDGGTASA